MCNHPPSDYALWQWSSKTSSCRWWCSYLVATNGDELAKWMISCNCVYYTCVTSQCSYIQVLSHLQSWTCLRVCVYLLTHRLLWCHFTIFNYHTHVTSQGSYVQASSQLRSCLLALGRPLPTTKLDLFASLFWNMLRCVMHWTGIGVWTEVSAGCLWRSVTGDDIRTSARDAAVVYTKLLQLHLTGETDRIQTF